MTFQPYQRYPRSAYAPMHARIRVLLPRVYPSRKGWGAGWPDCQKSLMVPVSAGGATVRMHRDIAELVRLGIEVTELMGYDVRSQFAPDGSKQQCGGTWGFSCRSIKGASGSEPSWHSWGLAIDINAPCNGQGSTWQCNIPPAVVTFWESIGFYWGGRYTSWYDPMHFERLGSPSAVATDLKTALAAYDRLKPPPPPPLPPGDDTVTPDQVKVLQSLLNSLGANLIVDGIYGPATDAALQGAVATANALRSEALQLAEKIQAARAVLT